MNMVKQQTNQRLRKNQQITTWRRLTQSVNFKGTHTNRLFHIPFRLGSLVDVWGAQDRQNPHEQHLRRPRSPTQEDVHENLKMSMKISRNHMQASLSMYIQPFSHQVHEFWRSAADAAACKLDLEGLSRLLSPMAIDVSITNKN
jgi:hypothetical protein